MTDPEPLANWNWLGFLLLVPAIAAAVSSAYAFMASEYNLTPLQWARFERSAKRLFALSVAIAVVAAWFAQRRPVRKSLFLALALAFPILSCAGGVLAFVLVPSVFWDRLLLPFR